MKKTGLILLPGMHGTSSLFKPFTDKAKRYFSISQYDYPQNGPQGYEYLSKKVADFILKTPGKQWIIGESFSGPMALMMAIEMPQKFHGVILSGTFSSNPSFILNLIPNAVAAEFILSVSKPIASYFSLGFQSGNDLKKFFSETIGNVPLSTLAERLMSVKYVNIEEELIKIKVPILSMIAKYDKMVGQSGRKKLKELANYKEVELNSNHLILQEKPDEALEFILNFTNLYNLK